MSDLAERDCEPCRGDVPAMQRDEIEPLAEQLPEWEVVDDHHLHRTFRFGNFAEALSFTNRVGELAEEQRHHPDLHLAWGRLGVEIWTHAVDGLTESDFVLAAKIDRLAS